MRRRQEIEPAAESLSAELEETVNEQNDSHDHQENGETINLERECETEEETIRDEDKDLEMKFINQLQNLQWSSLEVLPPRNRLEKLKMTKSIEESVERILGKYLKEVDEIPEITDVVYAMGKAIGEKIGITKKDRQQKKKPGNGNRRERKLKAEMKQLCQKIARINNEMHRRKEKRKTTKREKRNLADLKNQMGGVTTTNAALASYKEIWIDQLRYKKIKFEKMTERGERIKDNAMFEKGQRNFYNKIEKNEKFTGEQPEMEKFTDFWGGIWEKEDVTPMLPWMDNVKEELKKASINTVKEFTVEEERLIKIAKKRKNWTSPGIDGIQNYWWKKFKAAQKALKRAFE